MSPRRPPLLFVLLAGLFIASPQLRAQFYWDANGTATGAGATTPAGTWGTSPFWNTIAAGTGTTGAWVDGNTAVFSAGTDATGNYTVTVSGTQTIGGLTVEEGSPYLNGGILYLPGATPFDITGDVTINSTINGAGSLIKTGPGELSLSGSNTYTGGTTINGGTVSVVSNLPFGTGPVTVNSGGTLSVNEYSTNSVLVLNPGSRLAGIYGGYQNATIGTGVILAPGIAATGFDAIGDLTFDDLTLGPGGALEMHVKSNGATFSYDTVNVQNVSTLTISATSGNPFTLKLISLNSDYELGTLADGGLIAGNTYTLAFLSTQGISGTLTLGDNLLINASGFDTLPGGTIFGLNLVGDDYFLTFTPVPEPSTYALMLAGLGLSGLAAWRKRRRA